MTGLDSIIGASLGAGGVYLLKTLFEAIAPHLAGDLVDRVRGRVRGGKRVPLDGPQDLPFAVQQGRISAGDIVEGTGYFSLATGAGGSEMDQMSTMLGAMSGLLQHGLATNPFVHVFPTTRFPPVGAHRVGFLYPHHMFGFALPMFRDGTAGTVPMLGRQIVIVPESKWVGFENKIVKYKARLVEVDAETLAVALPGYSHDLYDDLKRNGLLYFLDASGEGGSIEYFEEPQHDFLVGADFINAHWDLPDGADRVAFLEALGNGVKRVVPAAQRMHDQIHGTVAWIAQGLQVEQSGQFPSVCIQGNRDLIAEMPGTLFQDICESVLESVDTHLKTSTTDLDATHDWKPPSRTILQSTAARQIDEPILKSVRLWLEKK